MKRLDFKEYIFPSLALVCICLAVTLALAGTYNVANPKIIENRQKAADEARMLVLPEGDKFTEYKGKLVRGVDECYIADNKTGMAVTAQYKGFGGPVKVMVGIDAEGRITGVKVTEHSETPGLGTKATDPGYLKQYKGMPKANEKNTGAEGGSSSRAMAAHISEDKNVDAVTGATITSNAVYRSIAEALDQFKECGGVN